MATQSSRMQRGKQPLQVADWSTILPQGDDQLILRKKRKKTATAGQERSARGIQERSARGIGWFVKIDQVYNRQKSDQRGTSEITSEIRSHQTMRERSRGSEYPDLRVTVSRAEGQAGLGMAAGRRRARTDSTATATRVK